MKIKEVTSRIKNTFKAVKQDAGGLSDRYLYSLVLKYGKTLMRRQDNLNRILKYHSIWKSLDCVKLEEISRASENCTCVISNCKILRNEKKLPKFIDGYWGPLIRFVTSLDQSIEIKPTTPISYEKMIKQKNFKYNKTKYYWYLDGYLYFPNIEWDAIRLECVPEDDITEFTSSTEDDCTFTQDKDCPIPEFLFSEIEQMIAAELGINLRIPPDQQHDNINVIE
ncbi:MAG: hypothetical protein EOL97_14000 [Spirochaetia bacterium]|nr:hypothetical protein [Spirochaetia bacterium]